MLEQFVWCVPMELYVMIMTAGMFSKSAPWDKLNFPHHGKHLIEIDAKNVQSFLPTLMPFLTTFLDSV